MSILLADGAMGTELMRRHPVERPASLNLLAPDLVLALHREYVDAGARLIVTNTVGATPKEAAAGVRLARQAANGKALVAFSLPSTLEALTGADVLILETVTSLATLEGVRTHTHGPLWATLSFDRGGRLDGLTPAEVVRRLPPLAAFGYGCGFGPDAARAVLREMRDAAPDARLIAKPNLGLPPYKITPEQLADWAEDMAALGVDVLGACCGSSPAHIRAVADRLDRYG